LIEQGKGRVIGLANDIEATLHNAVRLLAEIRRKLAALEPGKWSDTRADIMEQLQGLLENDFQRDTPADWLAQYPRYMKALLQRIERLAGQYAKDQTNTRSLQALLQPLQALRAVRPGLLLLSEEARTYRWMVEEFRVSLFAQNLGTRQAVSQKRLQEQWHLVSEWVDKNPH
jgi:ATP-dependent helicase HrpA